MNIGLIAHNAKKNLIEDFCVAYKRILEKHELYATGITGRRIEEATNLHVHKFLAGSVGGDKQFVEMIERNGLDMVIFFYSPLFTNSREPNIEMISKACDIYNIPMLPISQQQNLWSSVCKKVIWSGGKIYDDHRRWESFHVCRRPWYVPLRYAQYVRRHSENSRQ